MADNTTFFLGTTFLMDAAQSHLRVLISDPVKNANQIVIVGLTTLRDYKDNSCILERGAHPWITHDTCVEYRRAIAVSLEQLFHGKDSGAFKIQEPMGEETLQRIIAGAALSEFFPPLCLKILQEQQLLS
jgi:hypothetical protein